MKNKNEYNFFSGKNLALLRQILKKMMSTDWQRWQEAAGATTVFFYKRRVLKAP